MSGADLAVACRRQKQNIKIIFGPGVVELPKVDDHQLIADADILGKPYDEVALETAITEVRKSILAKDIGMAAA
ncbi:histidine kinase [Rhizobium sp.]|uniref:histidine kinase n=1 Tax=Rhizobium sp. TaxID=391 RepID=UPI0028B0B63B